ncbi:phage tail family protein [Actinoallomurus purpureus]|uniref:phage tail domain-containing protein n=1 Tax=Actinoallomurus purpureus TaxID=478114 RepID=UPI0020922A8B|nr:phage tail domain-containing protein [Actinoallomurus purpureus]MCO6011408.1 phage tail family protein [Actinoallomurus purpureus]
MPVLVGSQIQAGGGTDLPGVGFSVATWYAPDGTVWPLTDPDSGWFTLADGVSGLDAASISITTDDRPRGGVRVRHIQPGQRIITWPIRVEGEDHQAFINLWRAVGTAFTQTSRLGPGELEIARPDGTARRVTAYYQEGFEGQGKQGYGTIADFFVLTLLCEDPYWRDVTPQVIHRETATGVDFQSPYPSVSSAQVLGATTIENPGDAIAWPNWVVTGPASLLTATLTTTGESFQLNPNATAIGHGNLLAGEQVTISTDPPQVRFGSTNWIGALNWPGAVLWGIPPGTVDVTFQLDGSGAGSAIDLVFYPLYETA